MIVIHNFPRGARGVRLFWQCEEMGLSYETRAINFPPSPDYLALNPMGTVPFLQDGEVAMNESIAIMLYLAERYGPTLLLPKDDPITLAKILQLMVFTEATFGAGMNVLMAAHFGAPEADKQNWSQRVQADVNARALNFIENALGDRPYMAGERLTLADIAVSTALGIWKGALGKDIPPRLAAWRDRLAERPAYQRAQAAQQR